MVNDQNSIANAIKALIVLENKTHIFFHIHMLLSRTSFLILFSSISLAPESAAISVNIHAN